MSLVLLLEQCFSEENRSVPLRVDGVLDETQLLDTAKSIAEIQHQSGILPWFIGGHCDPWNLVETAMALDIAGFHDNALRIYCWLERNQLDNGCWHQYYLASPDDPQDSSPSSCDPGSRAPSAANPSSANSNDTAGYVEPVIKDHKFDVNTICYVATGLWCRYLIRRDLEELERFWPMVQKAIDWSLELQRDSGDIIWAIDPDDGPFDYSLLTGSSSIYDSLLAAIRIVQTLPESERSAARISKWEAARHKLGNCINNRRHIFEPKQRWAMDWYYPVLSGAVTGDKANKELDAGFDKFVIETKGVRCVSDQDWVTSAETCEAALAYLAADRYNEALELFKSAQVNRHSSGAYHTGYACRHDVYYPEGEHSTYTAAAVIICARVLACWQSGI